MPERVWLGVDVGTQGVRARAVTDDGRTIGAATTNLVSTRKGTTSHRQEPATWSQAAARAIRSVRADLGAHLVHAVAVDATSGTVTVVDHRGVPIGAGLMYDDSTAAAHTDAVRDAGADVWSAHGYRINPTWALVKIRALAADGVLGRGRFVAHQSDVVNAWLTGHRTATDASNALKSGYDQLQRHWPEATMARLGVDVRVLPDVVAPGVILGAVGSKAASLTGLAIGTPVVAGMSDACAAHLGAGPLELGRVVTSMGTTLTIKGVHDRLVTDDTGVLYSHPAPQDVGWLLGGASSCGAGVLSELFGGHNLERLTQNVIEDRVAPLPCYPLLGTGERFPWAAADARGFIGEERASLDATAVQALGPAVVLASVAHALAHLERACLDTVVAAGGTVDGPVTFTGGASANPWWNQLRCDILGRPVRVPTGGDAASGMAALARVGVTGEAVTAVTAQMATPSEDLEPEQSRRTEFEHAHTRFLACAPRPQPLRG
ncbi:FGGY-family carbohydrate kinase [Nocardioides sp.]|uniref:FGGY-family carbohydrate kinase n=1 Tax=Nocardioides sp. TaxID=35761 RepID=UPI002733C241|nr:FGGY-family carbohydrate kinase [Nocardioides sp.]MDP3894371.1 FGGY-family carbohydrate kinase [Nocardioides sp.]